ncbi:MAG: hypothetical protein HOQ24_02760 [Mycobacteriaceae bacterium]|nr:hypothetical protein [Mycobacteriaceae bacterium]
MTQDNSGRIRRAVTRATVVAAIAVLPGAAVAGVAAAHPQGTPVHYPGDYGNPYDRGVFGPQGLFGDEGRHHHRHHQQQLLPPAPPPACNGAFLQMAVGIPLPATGSGGC